MAATLFLTKEQIFLTRGTKEKRLTDFLTPYEPVLVDVKSLACWQRPLSSLIILVSIVLFLVLVPEQGCFFFFATSLFFGKTLNLSRSYGLWGVQGGRRPLASAPSSQPPISSTPHAIAPTSGFPSPQPVEVDVALLAQRLAPMWLHAEFVYERLLRLRWESRGKFCLVVSSVCLVGYLIGDVILPFHFLTVFVCLALTLPALSHHQLLRRTLKRFGPILMQFDLAMDIKRRPLAGRTTGDKRPMRGSRLQDIDEISDDLPLLNHTDVGADVVLRHDDDNYDDDDQATDGEDIMDEEVDPDELLFSSASANQRHPSRELLVQSHLELAPEDRLHSESERRVSRSMHVAGSRHSAPPSLFTTNKDLQDLGLVPFDEELETGKGNESCEEATGLTPDWSREASGDEDDDNSLMEFLPEGVSRMPSINSKRRSSNNDSLMFGDQLQPRQYVPPPRQQRDSRADQLSLVSAGTQLLASLATAGQGLRIDSGQAAITDNINHNHPRAIQAPPHRVESQIAEALMDEANGNRRGVSPFSSASSSSSNSGFEFVDRPNADAFDEQALLEAAMREEGLG